MEGKSSETMIADALVFLAAAKYFGLATKVICPATASSIPDTPEISVSGSPFFSAAPSVLAISPSFIIFGQQTQFQSCLFLVCDESRASRCVSTFALSKRNYQLNIGTCSVSSG